MAPERLNRALRDQGLTAIGGFPAATMVVCLGPVACDAAGIRGKESATSSRNEVSL